MEISLLRYTASNSSLFKEYWQKKQEQTDHTRMDKRMTHLCVGTVLVIGEAGEKRKVRACPQWEICYLMLFEADIVAALPL